MLQFTSFSQYQMIDIPSHFLTIIEMDKKMFITLVLNWYAISPAGTEDG